MLYQLHLYDTSKGMLRYRINELKTIRRNWDVAVLVGEFNSFAEESFACRKYVQNRISYVKWTYKTLNTGDNWGLFNSNIGYINLLQASYEEILEFFENNLSTANFDFNEEEMRVLIP